MAQRREEPKVRMVCEDCGSEEVTRDAWAEWNVDMQHWQLGAVFDYAYCHRCQANAHIEERPI
ncbi:hypothetical protein [Croceibacterium aestuarii]|uniref:hypothetical protein n=1 Tax=Croceibacterium aestuarii TaxID=3064139 RepID=UPI00272E2C2F|nr:hypothetical protein [Croceibacterium sp. D39]